MSENSSDKITQVTQGTVTQGTVLCVYPVGAASYHGGEAAATALISLFLGGSCYAY